MTTLITTNRKINLLLKIDKRSPVYVDLVLLSYPMCPGLRLQVVLRVPVRVEYDDGVSGGQVDAQAPCPGGQEEAEVRRPLRVEMVQRLSPNLTLVRR